MITSNVTAGSKSPLKFLTCGSVDDGKSTLIGRLLLDCGQLFDDQRSSLERDSRKYGTVGEDIDPALLMDGLQAEREQGITIDVAYRYFSTPRRRFIVADCPGHEQYTRNMATGASSSDAAVLLVDARKGLRTQTRRHAYICSLFGIKRMVLAVNKIDLVGFDRAVFDGIAGEFADLASELGCGSALAIPLSARHGDNVAVRSKAVSWYDGPTLITHLEDLDDAADQKSMPFRMPVQWVNRPNQDFRGYAGSIASGTITTNDEVLVVGHGRRTQVNEILAASGSVGQAVAGDAVTLVLRDEIDIARGDLLASPDAPPSVLDQFAAHIIWMAEQPLFAGRGYLLHTSNGWVPATVTSIRYRIDVDTRQQLAARRLDLNEIAVCNFSTARPFAFDPFSENRVTGAFILVDRESNDTVAAGVIDFPLRRASNVRAQALSVDQVSRAAMKGQKACILWFTGLSGAGKSTIARALERRLCEQGQHTYMLDGDNLRLGLNRDLGFTEQDRVENIRRAGEVARLMADAGLIVICSFISPFRADREMVRQAASPTSFLEVFVDAPIEECIRRDPKGLYAKAKAGKIPNFTGIDSPYEPPEAPDIRIETASMSVTQCVDAIIAQLTRAELIA